MDIYWRKLMLYSYVSIIVKQTLKVLLKSCKNEDSNYEQVHQLVWSEGVDIGNVTHGCNKQ